jgi:hypothetical protein
MRPAGRTRPASVRQESTRPEPESASPAHPPQRNAAPKQSSKQMKCPTMRDSDANLILIWRGLIASSSSAGIAACHRRRRMPAGPAAQSAAALQPLPNKSDRRHHRATRQARLSALALGLSARGGRQRTSALRAGSLSSSIKRSFGATAAFFTSN